jgi:hypothetical protein
MCVCVQNGRELTMRDQACNFFCYDGWVAVYIIVALFAFSWSIVGMAWVADEPSGSPCKEDYQVHRCLPHIRRAHVYHINVCVCVDSSSVWDSHSIYDL